MSPLQTQYQQWSNGRPSGNLPRPSNVFTDGTFTGLTPIIGPGVDVPNDDGLTDPRRYQYPVGWNMPIGVPGSESGAMKSASFEAIRSICQLYSVAAACIDLRINEIRGLNWEIVPTQEAQLAMRSNPSLHKDFQKRRAEVERFFKRPDSDYSTFSSWLGVVLYEVFTVDALALYMWPTRKKGKGLLGSSLGELAIIDGTTIKPLVDTYGNRPKPPNVAYQQYLYGVPRTDLMTVPDSEMLTTDPDAEGMIAQYRGNQLMYLPYNERRATPYGLAPIERALMPAMAGLARQQYQLDYFTEGTIPGVFVSPGDQGITPEQMRTLQDALNSLVGDVAWKHKIVVLPPGSEVIPQKSVELADQFDEVLMTQLCMAFGVMPMELGISPKVSSTQSSGAANQMAKASESVNKRKALKPMLMWLKQAIFDNILQEICGQADMEWMWEGLEEGTDEEAQMALLTASIANGTASIDEARVELGRQPWGFQTTTNPGFFSPTGFIAVPTGKPDDDGTFDSQKPKPEPGGFGGGGSAKPNDGSKPSSSTDKPKPSGGSTSPGASGADAGAAASDRAVGSKPGAGEGKTKAALAELDQLRRRLKQGKSIEGWECKSLDRGVLESMLYDLRLGEDKFETIEKARKSISESPHVQRRDDAVDAVASSVASGLGKLANGLRTGRIAGPEFLDKGTALVQQGIATGFKLGAAHALSDRGHPGHHLIKFVESDYTGLTRAYGQFWDDEAANRADAGRHYIMNLLHDVSSIPASKDVSDIVPGLMARIKLYGKQAMAAYETGYGVTAVAAGEAQAQADGEPPVILDDGTEVPAGEQIITWNTGGGEICSECMDRDTVQYTIDTLPGFPGDGFFGELCDGGPNCKCYLSYETATAENTIRTMGYAAERRGLAQDQQDRMNMVNQARQLFVSQLPASAAARAAERDVARAEIAREMGAHLGYTVWPEDVSAADVAARVAGRI